MGHLLQRLLLHTYGLVKHTGIFDLPPMRHVFETCYSIYKTRFEARNITRVKQYVRAGDLVVDIGANIGVLTTLFADWVGPNGAVIAIEPEPTNIAALRRRVIRQSLNQNVEILAAAAGDHDGRAWLQLAPQHPGDHHLVPTGKTADDAIEVDSMTLDSLLTARDRRCPSLLKIDVQGEELRVLRGALKTLARCRPLILIEIDRNALARAGSTEHQVSHFLDALGYAPYDLRTGKEIDSNSALLPPRCEYADLLFMPRL